jgi:hypothetical protein
MRDVRGGPGSIRGSVNDFIRLAARTKRHNSVRSHLITTIREDKVVQGTIGSAEENYRAHLSAEVEKLAGVDIFGQYTPDAIPYCVDRRFWNLVLVLLKWRCSRGSTSLVLLKVGLFPWFYENAKQFWSALAEAHGPETRHPTHSYMPQSSLE